MYKNLFFVKKNSVFMKLMYRFVDTILDYDNK
jgi:hypothetical protein